MQSNFHHYNPKLRAYAHELRNETVSKAEKFLWKTLLRRARMGVKFKRQRPIDRFIVDFFAQEIGLIIEIDGSSHLNSGTYDRYRQDRLEALGYSIIRFEEGEVLNELSDVHRKLSDAILVLKN